MDNLFVNLLATIFRPIFSIASIQWDFGGIKFSMLQMFIFCMFIGLLIKKISSIGDNGGKK